MIRRASIVICATALSFTAPAMAASKYAGTSGAAFLKMGAGARPAAMGNAYVAVSDDANATVHNPAGLSYLVRPEIIGMHAQWVQGMNYNFGAFSYPTDYGAFAISAQTLKIDGIQQRTADESRLSDIEAMDAAYGLSFSRNIRPLVAAGVTARLIRQEIGGFNASGWCMDLGLQHRFRGSRATLGYAVRNAGPGVKFNEASDPLPLEFDAGMSFPMFSDRLLFSTEMRVPRDNDILLAAGIENRIRLGTQNSFAVRGGYNTLKPGEDGTTGLTLGGGLSLGRLDLDFAWVPMGVLGDTFRYTARFKF